MQIHANEYKSMQMDALIRANGCKFMHMDANPCKWMQVCGKVMEIF